MTDPSLMAILMNPSLLLSVRSAVPGCARKDSVAPPMTMTIASPGPLRRMLEHDRLETDARPSSRMMSR